MKRFILAPKRRNMIVSFWVEERGIEPQRVMDEKPGP